MKSIRIAALAGALLFAGAAERASANNIVETASAAGQFGTLLAAAEAAGLAGALADGGPFTVFAPTDAAFAALPAGTVENLLLPENRDQLAAILSYHVLPRRLASNMLPGRTIHVRTIKQGGDRLLAVTKAGGAVTVDNATVVSADIEADNGIIHVIDAVMLPSS
ncbi:MAG: fasciclin domain-containing protein [Pseudomonadota bacterium]